MQNKLIVVGDLHIQEDEPLFSAQKNFFKYIEDAEFNNESNNLFLLGDIFHKSKPSAKEYALVHQWFEELKFETIYILHGNHTYSRKYGSALEPFKHLKNIQIIQEEAINITLDNLKIIALPFYPDHLKSVTMKEDYESLDLKTDYDFIFGHFSHKDMFGEKVDIGHLKGTRIMGHVHIRDDEYLGTPYPTRYDERGQIGMIKSIDMETKDVENIMLPVFIDYKTLDYKDLESVVANKLDKLRIYDITSAPSKDAVYELAPDMAIRNITLKQTADKSIVSLTEGGKEKKPVKEILDDFLTAQKASPKLRKILLDLM